MAATVCSTVAVSTGFFTGEKRLQPTHRQTYHQPYGGCRPANWLFHRHKFSLFSCTLEGVEGVWGGGGAPHSVRPF